MSRSWIFTLLNVNLKTNLCLIYAVAANKISQIPIKNH